SVLQRTQACLRLLRLELGEQPKALDLLDRAGRALDDLNRLFEDIGSGVTGPNLRSSPCDLRAVWRGAWEQAAARAGSAALDDSVLLGDPACAADPFRLGQVFANLFDNALAAGAAHVTIILTDTDLGGRA